MPTTGGFLQHGSLRTRGAPSGPAPLAGPGPVESWRVLALHSAAQHLRLLRGPADKPGLISALGLRLLSAEPRMFSWAFVA